MTKAKEQFFIIYSETREHEAECRQPPRSLGPNSSILSEETGPQLTSLLLLSQPLLGGKGSECTLLLFHSPP